MRSSYPLMSTELVNKAQLGQITRGKTHDSNPSTASPPGHTRGSRGAPRRRGRLGVHGVEQRRLPRNAARGHAAAPADADHGAPAEQRGRPRLRVRRTEGRRALDRAARPGDHRRPGSAGVVPLAAGGGAGLGLPRAALSRQAGAHLVAGLEPHRRRARRGRRLRRRLFVQRDRDRQGRERLRRRRPRVRADAAGDGADHDLPPGALRPLVGRRARERNGVRRHRRGSRRRDRSHPLRMAQPRPRAAERERIAGTDVGVDAVRLLPRQRGQPRPARQPADRRAQHVDGLRRQPPYREDQSGGSAGRRATFSSAPASPLRGSTTLCRPGPTRSACSTTRPHRPSGRTRA